MAPVRFPGSIGKPDRCLRAQVKVSIHGKDEDFTAEKTHVDALESCAELLRSSVAAFASVPCWHRQACIICLPSSLIILFRFGGTATWILSSRDSSSENYLLHSFLPFPSLVLILSSLSALFPLPPIFSQSFVVLSLSLYLSLSSLSLSLSLSLSVLSLSLSLSLFFSFLSRSRSLSLYICSLSLSLFFSFLSRSLSLYISLALFSLSLSLALFSLSLSISLALALSLSIVLSRSLSFSLVLSLVLSRSLSFSLVLSRSLVLSLSLSLPLSFSPRLSFFSLLCSALFSLSLSISLCLSCSALIFIPSLSFLPSFPPSLLFFSLPLSLSLSISLCSLWTKNQTESLTKPKTNNLYCQGFSLRETDLLFYLKPCPFELETMSGPSSVFPAIAEFLNSPESLITQETKQRRRREVLARKRYSWQG